MTASSYKQKVYYTGFLTDGLNVSKSNDLKALMLLLFVFILQFLLLKLFKVDLLMVFVITIFPNCWAVGKF